MKNLVLSPKVPVIAVIYTVNQKHNYNTSVQITNFVNFTSFASEGYIFSPKTLSYLVSLGGAFSARESVDCISATADIYNLL